MATKLILLFGCLFFLTGCSVPGRLITISTEPYTENFENTPVGSKKLVLNDFRLKEPITGYNISAEWTTDEILKTAAEAGISRVYYADKYTFAILSGLYKREKLIIYGD